MITQNIIFWYSNGAYFCFVQIPLSWESRWLGAESLTLLNHLEFMIRHAIFERHQPSKWPPTEPAMTIFGVIKFLPSDKLIEPRQLPQWPSGSGPRGINQWDVNSTATRDAILLYILFLVSFFFLWPFWLKTNDRFEQAFNEPATRCQVFGLAIKL